MGRTTLGLDVRMTLLPRFVPPPKESGAGSEVPPVLVITSEGPAMRMLEAEVTLVSKKEAGGGLDDPEYTLTPPRGLSPLTALAPLLLPVLMVAICVSGAESAEDSRMGVGADGAAGLVVVGVVVVMVDVAGLIGCRWGRGFTVEGRPRLFHPSGVTIVLPTIFLVWRSCVGGRAGEGDGAAAVVMVAVMVDGEGMEGLGNFGATSFSTFPVMLLKTNPEVMRPVAVSLSLCRRIGLPPGPDSCWGESVPSGASSGGGGVAWRRRTSLVEEVEEEEVECCCRILLNLCRESGAMEPRAMVVTEDWWREVDVAETPPPPPLPLSLMSSACSSEARSGGARLVEKVGKEEEGEEVEEEEGEDVEVDETGGANFILGYLLESTFLKYFCFCSPTLILPDGELVGTSGVEVGLGYGARVGVPGAVSPPPNITPAEDNADTPTGIFRPLFGMLIGVLGREILAGEKLAEPSTLPAENLRFLDKSLRPVRGGRGLVKAVVRDEEEEDEEEEEVVEEVKW